MDIFFLLFATLSLFLEPFFSSTTPKSPVPVKQRQVQQSSPHPVCILGAGISGINIANLLQDKKYTVRVFEKESRIGGKAHSYRVPGSIQVEMGPLLMSTSQKYLMPKVKQYNLTLVPFNASAHTTFDPMTGQIYPKPMDTFTLLEKVQLALALRNYRSYRAQLIDDLAYGYVNTDPASGLFDSTFKWLTDRGLTSLIPAFTIVMTGEGYGLLEDTPALYTLQLIDDTVINGLILTLPDSAYTLLEGFDYLVNAMAKTVDVSVNSTVVNINRTGTPNIVTVETRTPTGQTTTEDVSCSSVILAFPPLLPKVQNMIKDLTPTEKDVLGQVSITKYISSASSIPSGLDLTLYGEHPPILGTGEVTAFIQQSLYADKNIYSSYSLIRGDFNTPPNQAEIDAMNAQLAVTLSKYSNESKTFATYATEYFPHVNSQALAEGFYKKFDDLQGQNNIYYATTLLTFELMDRALQMTEEFVNRYF